MDLETNHWRISLDLSLFHPDTLFPQQSAQMERQAKDRENEEIFVCTAQLSVILTPQLARQVIILMNTCTRARTHTHTHTNTYAIVSLTFCSVAAAGQVFINRKYMSRGSQRMLSHSSSTRHLSQKTTKCTAKNLLSWGRLCRLTSCTANAPVNVGILTIF